MNYIAHIHIGFHTQTSLLGNFLGDFVKGQINQNQQLSPAIAEGVRLHRKVDQFTDSHPLVIQLKRSFPENLRRMSGIVIDVAFDHCLLGQWDNFTQHSKHHVFERFYQQLSEFNALEQPHFYRISHSLLNHKWLINYEEQIQCLHTLLAIERRLRHKIEFARQAYAFFDSQKAAFEQCFATFYPELLAHALHCKKQLVS